MEKFENAVPHSDPWTSDSSVLDVAQDAGLTL